MAKKAKESSELQRYTAKRIKRQASKNDRTDESLTGQVRDQAAHCPLTGRYFEPCGSGNGSSSSSSIIIIIIYHYY